ncbi:MAG: hypothetical protein ACP5D2_00490 [Candidatus Nanoarchaeia archaeon]
MRKIETAEEKDRKQKKKQTLIGGVMVLLLIMSTAGYAILSGTGNAETNIVEYNGFKFKSSGGYWILQSKQLAFQYLPQEVENVSIDGQFNLQQYNNKPLYFVNNNPASQEIIYNLQGVYLRWQEACLNECDNLPIKNCSSNLIIFKESEETRVYKDENCVYITGNYIKATDAFIYKLLDII